MKKIGLLMLCMVASSVYAADIYKCVQDGKLTISSEPCPPGATSTVVTPDAQADAPAPSPDEELARLKQQVEAMERERLDRNAARDAAEAERRKARQETKASEEEATEPVNAHGRLNAARKKREEAANNNNNNNGGGNNGNAGGNANGGSGGDAGGTGKASGSLGTR